MEGWDHRRAMSEAKLVHQDAEYDDISCIRGKKGNCRESGMIRQ